MTEEGSLTDGVQMGSAGGEDQLPAELPVLMGSAGGEDKMSVEVPARGSPTTDGVQAASSPTESILFIDRPMSSPTGYGRPGTSQSLSSQCEGQDGMMGLVRALMTGILQPFAENVEELHKMGFSMADSIGGLRTQVDNHDPILAEQAGLLAGVRSDLDQTMEKVISMHTALTANAEQDAAATEELKATASNFKAISKQTLDKLDAVNVLTQNSINGLQKSLDKHSNELAKLDKAERDLQECTQGNSESIDRLAAALEVLDENHSKTAEAVTGNKQTFDSHVLNHEQLQQEHSRLCRRFEAFQEEMCLSNNSIRKHLVELDSQVLQTQTVMEQQREEARQTHLDSVAFFNARLGAHDESFEKATVRFQGIDVTVGDVQERVVHNGENTSKLIKLSDEKRVADVERLRKEVEALGVDASRHSRLITELQEVIYGRPPQDLGHKNYVPVLREEMSMSLRRFTRLEQMFGLEPLKEDSDDDAHLTLKNGILLTSKQIEDFQTTFNQFDADGSGEISVGEVSEVLKSLGHDVPLDVVQCIMNDIDKDRSGAIVFDEFCSLMSKMLGPDGKVDVDGYLRQASEDAERESKQNQMAELLPVLKKDVEQHASVIQQEQSKLTNTSQRVNNLEGDHAAVLLEIAKLRKGLEQNNEYWKGLSQGLKETKKTVRTDGEGGMLPNARNLRNLPPLANSPGHSSTR